MTEYIIEAKDRRSGMDFEELEAAIKRARDLKLTGRPRARLGFKSQVQALKFSEEPRV